MLCDPKNVLSRINKNLVYDIINSRENTNTVVNKRFLESWREFIFNYYFKLIFAMIKNSNLKHIKVGWKNVRNFDDRTTNQELMRMVQKKQVMVSIYEIPKWLAHQELNQYKEVEKSNYIFIMYNPKAPDGKKLTLSYHKSKFLEDVQTAEIRYNQVLTKKSLIGISIGLIFFFVDWLEKSIETTTELFGYALLFGGGLLLLFDLYNLLKNSFGDGFSDVITSYRKSMSGRVDSSSTLVELEHLNRIEKSLITKSILEIMITKKINVNDVSQLYLQLSRIYPGISKNYIINILKEIDEYELIEIMNNGEVNVNVTVELLNNHVVLDERLYELFDLNDQIQDVIYKTYRVYLYTINRLLESENMERLDIDDCS